MNVLREFDRQVSNHDIDIHLASIQGRIHDWGHKNRVTFDSAKEHFVTIHLDRRHHRGEEFKFLGVWFEPSLSMSCAMEKLMTKLRPKVEALLHTRAYYSTADMIAQYKTHIWGLYEFQFGALFHATAGVLKLLDNLHNHFLRHVQCTEVRKMHFSIIILHPSFAEMLRFLA